MILYQTFIFIKCFYQRTNSLERIGQSAIIKFEEIMKLNSRNI